MKKIFLFSIALFAHTPFSCAAAAGKNLDGYGRTALMHEIIRLNKQTEEKDYTFFRALLNCSAASLDIKDSTGKTVFGYAEASEDETIQTELAIFAFTERYAGLTSNTMHEKKIDHVQKDIS